MSPLTDPLGPDLTATLRALKLGKLTATLPERLTLARVERRAGFRWRRAGSVLGKPMGDDG